MPVCPRLVRAYPSSIDGSRRYRTIGATNPSVRSLRSDRGVVAPLRKGQCRVVGPRPKPGFAWYIVCDAGFAVGLVTHYLPKWGHLVWMAEPFFDEEPTLEDVLAIRRWRWPVLFPLGAAVHRRIATPIGVVPIPAGLNELPVMRSGTPYPGQRTNWMAMRLTESGDVTLGGTKDKSLPVFQIVNDVALKAMLVSGWKPEDDW